jgi:hypothetical protein
MTSDLETWVEKLWELLNRAGDHFHHEVSSEEDYEGDKVIMPLRHALPKKAKKPIEKMIKIVAREHEWKIKKIEFYKNRVEVITAPELGLKLPKSPQQKRQGRS